MTPIHPSPEDTVAAGRRHGISPRPARAGHPRRLPLNAFEDAGVIPLAWVKLDDQFHWHPKIAGLGSDAYRLFVGGLCVCNTHHTGGVIWASRFATAAQGARMPKRALAELLEAGLWVEIEGGWEVHDYGTYQPTSEAQREAARKAGLASVASRRQRSVNETLNETLTEGQRNVERSVNETFRARAAVPATGRSPGSRIPIPVTTGTTTPDGVSVPPLGANAPSGGDMSPAAADEFADPVERVCQRMYECAATWMKRPPVITAHARHEARLMLTRDGRLLDEVLEVIAWVEQHTFWRRNVQAVPKLREQYDRLVDEMRAKSPPNGTGRVDTPATIQARRLEAMAAEMEARGE